MQTLITLESPVSFLIKNVADSEFVLFTAEFPSGEVASSVLPLRARQAISRNLQQVLQQVPAAAFEAAFPNLVRSVLSMALLEDPAALLVSVEYSAGVATVTLSGLPSLAHIEVAIPQARSAGFVPEALGVAALAAQTGLTLVDAIVATDVSPTIHYAGLLENDIVAMVRPSKAAVVTEPAAVSQPAYAYGSPSGDSNLYYEAALAGEAGNDITVANVGDAAPGTGITIHRVGKAFTIHFEAGVSTEGDVATTVGLLAGPDRLFVVQGNETPEVVWTLDNEQPALNFEGGADRVEAVIEMVDREPIVTGTKMFVFDGPSAPSVDTVHADLAGNALGIKAFSHWEGTLLVSLGLMNTVIEAVAPGLDGNAIRVAFLGDSVAGVTIDVDDSSPQFVLHTIHFWPGHTTVLNVENAITALADPYIQVKTPGTAANVLTFDAQVPTGNAYALTGGTDSDSFPGPFTSPTPYGTSLSVTFGVDYDGGDVIVLGTGLAGDEISETFWADPGSTVQGEKIFTDVISASRTLGTDDDPACIGIGTRIGVSQGNRPVSMDPSDPTAAMLWADGVLEEVILDSTESAFTPTTPPDGAIVFKLLVNVMGEDPTGMVDHFTIAESADLGRPAVIGNLYLVFRRLV